MDPFAANSTPPASDTRKKWDKWLTRIEDRKKVFESGWWKLARKAEKMYDIANEAETQDTTNPFNVLYANTEVLLPALYSATPRPDVVARAKQGKDVFAKAAEAFLVAFLDMNTPGRETFDDSMELTTLSALVPGAGFSRIRYYPGESCPLRTESGSYKELIWGKARKWSKVPWIAFVHIMTKEDIVSQFKLSDEDAARLNAPTQAQADAEKNTDKQGPDSPIYVYELWVKESRQTVWLCDGYEDLLLEEPTEDVLKLSGFFPTPGPLTLVKKTSGLDPTPIYEYYRNQAEELNRVTTRLNRVLAAIRVRGAYNPILGDEIKNILGDGAMENGLVPAQNPMDLQGRGFEGHIWFMPIEKLIVVAKELYTARQQIMGVIQQITGLSDIIRGSTVASETATAQGLKDKWGSIRLKRMQRLVAFYVRDLLRMAINAGANVVPAEAWKQMTQLSIPLAAEKQQAVLKMQSMVQQAQMTGQQPPPPPPEVAAMLQSPTWEDILSLLASDNGRIYTIDIETNSSVDSDATADKEEVSEFMAAMGQLLPGLAPLAEVAGASGLEATKKILIAVTSKFKFGREVKEAIEGIQFQPPQQDPGAAQKGQAEAQSAQAKAQADIQVLQVETQAKTQKAQSDSQLAIQANQLAMSQSARDEQMKQREFELKIKEYAMKERELFRQEQLSQIKLEVAQKMAKDRMSAPPAGSKSR